MRKKAFVLALITAFAFVLPFGFGCGGNKVERSEYIIDCSLEGNVLSATEKFTYYNDTETAINELKFNLYGNAFRDGAKYSPIDDRYKHKCYYNGQSFGSMTVLGVTDEKELALDFSICGEDENVLSVRLNEEVYPQERVEVVIEYRLTLAEVISRTGVTPNTVNLGNFYPVLCARDESGFYECNYYSLGDPFYSDAADYEVCVTLDNEFVVAASGKRISSETNGNSKSVKYRIENARSFAMSVSKQFEAITVSSDETEITYYFYQDETPQDSVMAAARAVELFAKKFGEYPYSDFTVVQTPFNEGGMEYASLVFVSAELEKAEREEVIVHETAHQWWQSAVGNNEIENGFLDEGLAEYSVVLFYENYPEYGITREQAVKSGEDSYHAFCSVFDKLFGEVNTCMTRSLKDFSGEYEYVNIAYIKGFLMHEYLRQTIGDEKYFEGLKRYYREFAFKNATPADLVGAFERSGANSNGYFQSFFDGSAII